MVFSKYDLKNHNLENIKPSEAPGFRLELMFAGKKLEDDKTLAEYGVTPRSTFYVIFCGLSNPDASTNASSDTGK